MSAVRNMDCEIAAKKAELILAESISVPESISIPVRISKSTAGPGAGSESIVFAFSGTRVKKAISRSKNEFELKESGNGYAITKQGAPFLNGVTIQPVGYHCPEQAFFNIDNRCIHHCVYCVSPMLGDDAFKGLDEKIVLEKIRSSPVKIEAVAFTSGVVGSTQETVDRMCGFVKAVKNEYPDMPIGVEPYVDSHQQIDQFCRSGAIEIKINCETATADLFSKVCPGLDYDNVFEMLRYSVEKFGIGNVASNVIIGLGESDDQVEHVIEKLASMGVVPGLRPLKASSSVRENIEKALGTVDGLTPERIVHLGKIQKRILEKHNLSTGMKTMCFRCTCCDLVPFKDF